MPRIVEFDRLNGPDALRLVEREERAPGEGEARLRMAALGLNRAELLFMAGHYVARPVLPSRIGMEGVGTVEAVGPDVRHVRIGDAVCVTPSFDVQRYGVAGDTAIVPAASLVARPPGLLDVEATALWMAYPTAYGGLVEWGGLDSGEGRTVVISAASSSVGLAAIQVAKARRATVIASTRTGAKAETLRHAGADRVVATDSEDLAQAAREMTGGRGADLLFDPVGGPFLRTLAAAAAPEAVIVNYGILAMAETPYPLFEALGKGLTIKGFHVGFHIYQHADRLARVRQAVIDGVSTGIFKPLIDRTFPLEQIADAYRHLESGTQLGKIVVTA